MVVEVVDAESLSRFTRGCRMSRRPRFGPIVAVFESSDASTGSIVAEIGVLLVMNLVAEINVSMYVKTYN